jgi:hypothetical protein
LSTLAASVEIAWLARSTRACVIAAVMAPTLPTFFTLLV